MSGDSRLSVADVILAIVWSRAGRVCLRGDVDAHPAWSVAGWKPRPVPSSITRAARRLEREGLLARRRGWWRVLPAGEARAVEAMREIATRRHNVRRGSQV